MPRPILDAIRQFRSNRQERVAERRENIRGMLGMSDSGKPRDRMIPHLLRSLGAGTSRQDLLWSRKAVAKPPERAYQDNPAGPDTGKDANHRPYDGDGMKAKTVSTKVVPVIPEDETETIKAPAPIQGGTQSLPAPPQATVKPEPAKPAPAAQATTQATAKRRGPPPGPNDEIRKELIEQYRRDINNPNVHPLVRQRQMQELGILLAQTEAQDMDRAESYGQTMEGRLDAFRALGEASPDQAAAVFPTTDFAKGPDGRPAYGGVVPGAMLHRNTFITDHLLPTAQRYGSFSEMPDADRFLLLDKARGAYPVPEFQSDTNPAMQDAEKLSTASLPAMMRIYREMSRDANPTNNPNLDRWIRGSAYYIIRKNNGEFDRNDSPVVSRWLDGGEAPQAQPRSPKIAADPLMGRVAE